PLVPPPGGGRGRRLLEGARPALPVAARVGAERPPRPVGVGEPLQRGPDRRLHPAGRFGDHPRSQVLLMPDYETHEVDVLVIGAGGAGLRAAVETHARGARTAIVCKSLLGKAHTVMAEGGG